MFTTLTILSVVGLVLGLSYRSFLTKTKGLDKLSLKDRILSFFTSLPGRTVFGIKSLDWKSLASWIGRWAKGHFSGWKVWGFYGLLLSFVFLALSGFGFALFCPRGLFGLPLLLHVIAGGIFAV